MGSAGSSQGYVYLPERLLALRANLVRLTWWRGACSLICQMTAAVGLLRKRNLHPRRANFQRGVGDRARPRYDLGTVLGGLAVALLGIPPGWGLRASSRPGEPRFTAERLKPL